MPVYAGPAHLIVNGKSFHIDAEHDWNEENYGFGVEYEFDSRSRWIKTLSANAFEDSQDAMSYMAGGGLHRRLIATDRFGEFYVDVGINVFLMSREDMNDRRPFPGALPSLTIGSRYGGLNVSYIPKAFVHDFAHANVVDPNIKGVFFLQLKIRLDQLFRK